jgi:hypothetical protein
MSEPKLDGKVEAYGVKGMKSLRWRKIFKNLDAMNKWVEENDAEVHATTDAEPGVPVTLVKESVDNDYTYLDSFLSKDITDISRKPLSESSNNDNIDEKETIKGFDNRIGDKDEVGAFWVVTKPSIYGKDTATASTLGDICFKSTILGMANQIRGGLKEEEIWGFYTDKAVAIKIAKELLKDKKTWIKKD